MRAVSRVRCIRKVTRADSKYDKRIAVFPCHDKWNWNSLQKIFSSPPKSAPFDATVSAREAVTDGSMTWTPQRRARGARVVSSRQFGGRVGRRALGRRGGLTPIEIGPWKNNKLKLSNSRVRC